MQPKQNTWNLVLFVVISALVLVGWGRLQNWINPPPPRVSRPVVLNVDPRLWADLLARTSESMVSGTVPGAGTVSQLAADLAIAQQAAHRRHGTELARKPERKPEPPKQPPKPSLPAGKHQLITMGGDGFNLQATLTTRGAGVQGLVLTRFKAADEMGRPVDVPMQLIPEDRLSPSFTLDQVNDEQHRLRDLEWTVVSQQTDPDTDKHEVVLSADIPDQDVRVTKTYTLTRGDYHIALGIEVERRNASPKPAPFSYVMTGAHGLPIEGVWYTNTYRNALIGTVDTSNHLWRDFQDARSIDASPHKDETTDNSGYIQYAGVAIQYFASVIVVDDQQPKKDFLKDAQPFVESKPDPKRPYLDDISVRVSTVPVELKSGDKVVHKYLLYNGPVKVQLLGDAGKDGKPIPPELLYRYLDTLHLNTLTDYHSPGGMGWFASRIYWTNVLIFFTNLMHRVLEVLHTYIPFANYGICIILLTLLVRGLMHPISRKQARTSIKMQALLPELKKLQEKYKNDKQAQAVAQMDLYRKHGVHPMGSCWVVFLQMPIFMGLYYALQESIHFRLAPFLWIKNLAAPDMLIYWGQNIPWISRPEDMGGFLYLGPYFNLLPVFAVTLMIIQQKFLMPPATDEAQEMQQKMMKYMSIFFGILFYKVAAGLCIYFIVSSLWGIAERQLLPKAKLTTAPAASEGGQGATSARPSGVRPRPRAAKSGQTNGTFQRVQEMWTELLKQAKKK